MTSPDEEAPIAPEPAPAADDAVEPDDAPDAFDVAPPAPPAAPAPGEAEFAQDVVKSDEEALSCIRCGNSCRSVYLWQGDVSLFKERDTKKWVEFHEIDTFTAKMPDGKTFWGIKLPKPCKYLIVAEDGKHACAVYDRRPYVCRIYRGVNPDGPQPGCGFHRAAPP